MRAGFSIIFLGALTTSPALAAQTDGTCAFPVFVMADIAGLNERGPDFLISRFQTEKGVVSIYTGCCSSVSYDEKTPFVTIDGQRVFRTSGATGFSGYLTTRIERHDGTDFHYQAHFFGGGLYGDDRDQVFFKQVRLGEFAARRCKDAN